MIVRKPLLNVSSELYGPEHCVYFQNLTQELKFVAHLNITIFMMELRNANIENLAAMINQFLVNKLAQFQVSLTLTFGWWTNF